MNKLFVDKSIKYTGAELAPHWIYRSFNLQGDTVVAFCGEVEVALDKMVDIEDVLNNEPIYSKNMLNFIIEHFEISLTEAVLRQRMFICIIKEALSARGLNVERSGDDLFFEGGKLSVSIAAKSLTSCLIHTGINICAKGAPVKAFGLEQAGVSDIKKLALDIMDLYDNEMTDVRAAVSKVRGVY